MLAFLSSKIPFMFLKLGHLSFVEYWFHIPYKVPTTLNLFLSIQRRAVQLINDRVLYSKPQACCVLYWPIGSCSDGLASIISPLVNLLRLLRNSTTTEILSIMLYNDVVVNDVAQWCCTINKIRYFQKEEKIKSRVQVWNYTEYVPMKTKVFGSAIYFIFIKS